MRAGHRIHRKGGSLIPAQRNRSEAVPPARSMRFQPPVVRDAPLETIGNAIPGHRTTSAARDSRVLRTRRTSAPGQPVPQHGRTFLGERSSPAVPAAEWEIGKRRPRLRRLISYTIVRVSRDRPSMVAVGAGPFETSTVTVVRGEHLDPSAGQTIRASQWHVQQKLLLCRVRSPTT